MSLYGGIDLHANNSVVVLINEQDEVLYRKRLPNGFCRKVAFPRVW
jgi:transposase